MCALSVPVWNAFIHDSTRLFPSTLPSWPVFPPDSFSNIHQALPLLNSTFVTWFFPLVYSQICARLSPSSILALRLVPPGSFCRLVPGISPLQLYHSSSMASYDGPSSTSSSFTHGQNIPILGIENYYMWATRMRFSFCDLQVLVLKDADPPRLAVEKFSAANIKLTGQAMSLITSKMVDAAMDLTSGAERVEELWSRLLAQYHEKEWGAESILFQRLVHQEYSDCENTQV